MSCGDPPSVYMSTSSRYDWSLLARVAGKGTVAAAFLNKLVAVVWVLCLLARVAGERTVAAAFLIKLAFSYGVTVFFHETSRAARAFGARPEQTRCTPTFS